MLDGWTDGRTVASTLMNIDVEIPFLFHAGESFGVTMPTTSPGSAASPAELKDMGNKLYTQRKYDEAIECYRCACRTIWLWL